MPSPETLRQLLGELDLTVHDSALPPLLRFLDELLRWNRRINLTAIRDPEEAEEKHLADSLTLLPLLEEDDRLLDLGSGGGLPGIPLKIARPRLKITSVETVGKKAAFQRHASRLLGLTDFQVIQERAEELPGKALTGRYATVVSRAFASLEDFASLALPFLAPGGKILAMKGPEGEAELVVAAPALHDLGLECRDVLRLNLPRSGAARTLLILVRR